MKTILPKSINTVFEAKKLLKELYINEESYHPEDDANDIGLFTREESFLLNKLMNDIYELDENKDYLNMFFDPCEYLLYLSQPI